MKTFRRYLTVFMGLVTLLLVWKCLIRVSRSYYWTRVDVNSLESYMTKSEILKQIVNEQRPTEKPRFERQSCQMRTCFDFTRCQHGFKVYIYPDQPGMSSLFKKILEILRQSKYFTKNPDEACLLIPSLDTLDRDTLSENYVQNLVPQNLPYWNEGRNHLIMNMYSGTWPDYSEELGFDPEHALLAKASLPSSSYRPGFDVSMPLFKEDHASKAWNAGQLKDLTFPPKKKYVLAFKGKRYLTGIGSETRNSLYHLHNGHDIILLTTCKHGKDWQLYKDERCDIDNQAYDHFDYVELLVNSTFCLVPRGRRLGTYRFIEVLRAGCVPVVLSKDWELPFSEVIQWRDVAVIGDERLLLQIPMQLRSIPPEKIFEMRQMTQHLYNGYFGSIETILMTMLRIIRDRIFQHFAANSLIWQYPPGALVMDGFEPWQTPFYSYYHPTVYSNFTALLIGTNSTLSSLRVIVKSLCETKLISHIVVVLSDPSKWNQFPIANSCPLVPVRSAQEAYLHLSESVLLVRDNVTFFAEEVDFAFQVWKEFPDQLVGFVGRRHHWSESAHRMVYSSRVSNSFSFVLTHLSFVHKFYLKEFLNYSHPCFDVQLNSAVTRASFKPAIKVGPRKRWKTMWIESFCFDQISLLPSDIRFDPTLFRDPVANLKKRYRKMELIRT